MFLFDVAPSTGGVIGLAIAAVFFLIFAGIAALAFFMIRRTVKMALRLVIVALILMVAVVGSLALFSSLNSGGGYVRPQRPERPPVNSRR